MQFVVELIVVITSFIEEPAVRIVQTDSVRTM